MRRIIASVSVTLDGFMEGPRGEGDLDWLMPFVGDGLADSIHLLSAETDTILLGRLTYHGFSQFWPFQEGDYADLMNRPPKLVFSSAGSLKETTWGAYGNASLIDQEVGERVRDLKAKDGKDMVILASGGLVSSFLGLGLVDELRILLVPVVLGEGKRYLRDMNERVGLELLSSKIYPSGGMLLSYRVSRGGR
jgi:dihydrofolate reductase